MCRKWRSRKVFDAPATWANIIIASKRHENSRLTLMDWLWSSVAGARTMRPTTDKSRRNSLTEHSHRLYFTLVHGNGAEKITSRLLLFYVMISEQEFIMQPHPSASQASEWVPRRGRQQQRSHCKSRRRKLLWRSSSKWRIVGGGLAAEENLTRLNILAEACCWLSFLQIIHKPHIWWCGNYSCCFLLSSHVSTSPAFIVVYCAENFIVRKSKKCLTSTGYGRRAAGFAGVDGKCWSMLWFEESVHQQQSEMFCFEWICIRFGSHCRVVVMERWLFDIAIWLVFGQRGR